MHNKSPLWLAFLPDRFRRKIVNEGFVKIITNNNWLLFDRVSRLLMGVIVGTWVARYLGPSQFGNFTIIGTYISFFQAFAIFGLTSIVVRELNEKDIGQVLGTTFFLRLVFGIASWCIFVSFCYFYYGLDAELFIVGLFASGPLVFQFSDTVELYYQSSSKSKYTVMAKLSSCIISNILKVVLILNEAGLEYFALLLSVEAAISMIFMIFVFKKQNLDIEIKYCYELAIKMVNESRFFVLASLINLIQARIEIFVIELFLDVRSVGQYGAALRIVEIFNIIGITVTSSVFPKLVKDYSCLELRIKMMYRVMTCIYILVTLPGILFFYFMFPALYGGEYVVAQELLLLMCLRPFLTYIGLVRGMLITIEGIAYYATITSIVGCLCSFIYSYYFVSVYGLQGAVISGTLSYLTSIVLLDYVMYRKNWNYLFGCIK